MEKDLLLSRLYTLRAGISAVSAEKDENDRILSLANTANSNALDSAKRQKDNKVAEAKSKRDKAEKRVSACNRVLKNNEKELNDLASKASRSNDKEVKKATTVFALLVAFSIFSILCSILGIVYISLGDDFWANVLNYSYDYSTHTGNNEGLYSAVMIIGCLMLVVGPIAAVVLIIFAVKKSKALKECKAKAKEISNSKNKYSSKKNSLEKEIEEAKQDLARAEVAFTAANKKYLEECTSIESEYAVALKDAQNKLSIEEANAKTHITAGSALITVLNNTFSDIVDYRDWGNIDYIIYTLETRRADTMKEALQLTDQEKRADRIVEAVRQASVEICRTLDLSIGRLQNDMRLCFNVLNDRMTAQANTILNSVGTLKADFKTQSSYLTNLTSELNLNNSLRAKANISSERLADDVEYIRKAIQG